MFLDLPRRVAKVLLSQAKGDDGAIGVTSRQERLGIGPGHPATRQRGAARLRKTWPDLGARPGHNGRQAAALGPSPAISQSGVGKLTDPVSAR
jgi:hypothetical protein